MLKRPQKIEAIGLKKYLDDTYGQHNGLMYNNFESMVKLGVDKSNLAKAFGVSRDTIYRWIDILKREGGFDEPRT